MNYKKIDEKDIQFLISILGQDRVYVGEQINEDFAHDELASVKKNARGTGGGKVNPGSISNNEICL